MPKIIIIVKVIKKKSSFTEKCILIVRNIKTKNEMIVGASFYAASINLIHLIYHMSICI